MDPSIPVTTWMEQTIWHVGFDHRRVSPTCQPKELKDLMIPHPKDAEWVGQAPKT